MVVPAQRAPHPFSSRPETLLSTPGLSRLLKPNAYCLGRRDGLVSFPDQAALFSQEKSMFRPGRLFVAAMALTALVSVTRVQAIDPKYLPSDTEIIVTLNVKQIL